MRNHVVAHRRAGPRVLEVLMTHAFQHNAPAFGRSINVRIARLCKRLGDDADEPKFIRTVRNGGYVSIASIATA